MLFFRHSFGVLALTLLFHPRQTLAEEDPTLFETEFRLMIMTGDPDHDMVTVEGEDGTLWEGKWEDEENEVKQWFPGVANTAIHGNWRMSYMAWSRPSDKERKLWHYHKGQDKDSGRKVHCLVCKHRDHELTVVYHSLESRS